MKYFCIIIIMYKYRLLASVVDSLPLSVLFLPYEVSFLLPSEGQGCHVLPQNVLNSPKYSRKTWESPRKRASPIYIMCTSSWGRRLKQCTVSQLRVNTPSHTLGTSSVSRILSIPGYLGSSLALPHQGQLHTFSVQNTKYPGILGILPSSPALGVDVHKQCPEY